MDIHRGRFIPYPPSAINALAFSHSSGEELFEHYQDDLRLAVGRANGDIEIWNPAKGAWVQETVFHGGKDRSVEGLAWTQDAPGIDKKGNSIPGALRLFSIGYSSTVTEWDLATGLPLRNSTGNYSEVWCLAAQPRWTKTVLDADGKQVERQGDWQEQNLAIGCADGTLAILSTADNDLQFLKFLARQTEKRARVLTLTWKDRNTVVAGFANSSIGIYDAQKSACIRTITLGAGPKSGPKDILVWAVKCLPNGDLISGDSTGEVRFFEGKQYSQYQRLAGHDADLLDLAVSADGETIWSTGMDRRTAVYTRAKKGPSGRGTWSRNQVKTYHDHDVKAMATFEFGGKQQKMSVIASGGIDANLVIIPMRGFWTENHRTISGLPQQSTLVSAPRARLVVSWWERELSVWKISARDPNVKPYKALARIALKGDENITSASITEDGALIAAATATAIRLFRRVALLGGRSLLKQIHSEVLDIGARQVQFSPDGKWLALITHTNEVRVARILYQDTKPFIRVVPGLIPLEPQTKRKAKDRYSQTLTRLQFSPTSQMLVASDLAGRIHSWLLHGDESSKALELDIPEPSTASESDISDSSDEDAKAQEDLPIKILNQYWAPNPSSKTLPRLQSPPILLTFRPRNPSHLVILTATHQLYEFDLSLGQLTSWSRRNPSSRLPEKFTTLLDRAMGCVWHAYPHTQTERLWLYGSSWVFMLDLARDLEGEEAQMGRKRKRAVQSGAGDEQRREEVRGLRVESARGKKKKLEEEEDGEGEGKAKVPLEMRITRMTGEELEQARAEEEGKKKGEKWWVTFKYRPILGMVPIGDPESRGKKQKKSVEVLLVERPVWDLDLPERFAASYDR